MGLIKINLCYLTYKIVLQSLCIHENLSEFLKKLRSVK